jgi:hypothetical protein
MCRAAAEDYPARRRAKYGEGAEALVNEWNEKYSPGTRVAVTSKPQEDFTSSQALLDSQGRPVINCQNHIFVPLECVRPLGRGEVLE